MPHPAPDLVLTARRIDVLGDPPSVRALRIRGGGIAAPGGGRKVRTGRCALYIRRAGGEIERPAVCSPARSHPMRIRSLAVLLALAAAAPAAAQEATPYRSPAGFVLDLPAGWVRAPDAAAEEVSRAAGTPPAGLTYEAVYQVGGSRWPAPPFVAIARGVTPRWLTPEEFRRRWTANDAQTRLQGGANRADTLRSGRVGMEMGVPWWDSANRAAWLRAESDPLGGFAWTVMMLHPSGGWMIMLVYYAAAGADEGEVLAQLDAVVRSLRVD
jgi:hypothetical protein